MSSARELVLERSLVAPLLSPWLVPRDVMSLSETSQACLREVRAGLPELNLNEKFGITDEHVITIARCFPSLRLLAWFDTFRCPPWYPGPQSRELVRLIHEILPNPEQSHRELMQVLGPLTPRGQ